MRTSEEKARLTVTVDRELLRAGRAAVAAGQVRSLSAWVNAALAERVAHDLRRAATAEAIAAYEAEHGKITAAEMEQARIDATRALVVRGPRPAPAPDRPSRGRTFARSRRSA